MQQKKNAINWTPDDIEKGSAASRGGKAEAFVHPLDPRRQGGIATITTRFDPSDRDVVNSATQRTYRDEGSLKLIVSGLVDKRKRSNHRGLEQLHDKLSKFDKDDKSALAEEFREQIAELEKPQFYAWRHVKKGTWTDATALQQGMPPKLGYIDLVDVILLTSRTELEHLNGKIKPIPAAPFDGEYRTVTPLWQLIG